MRTLKLAGIILAIGMLFALGAPAVSATSSTVYLENGRDYSLQFGSNAHVYFNYVNVPAQSVRVAIYQGSATNHVFKAQKVLYSGGSLSAPYTATVYNQGTVKVNCNWYGGNCQTRLKMAVVY